MRTVCHALFANRDFLYRYILDCEKCQTYCQVMLQHIEHSDALEICMGACFMRETLYAYIRTSFIMRSNVVSVQL